MMKLLLNTRHRCDKAHICMYTCIPVYLYTCILVVGPAGSSGRQPSPKPPLGSRAHRFIGELGPQASQGASPECGHSATGASGHWACRLVGAPRPHPDEQGQQTCEKKQHIEPTGSGHPHQGVRAASPSGRQGPQARRGSRGPRHIRGWGLQAHQGVLPVSSTGSQTWEPDENAGIAM